HEVELEVTEYRSGFQEEVKKQPLTEVEINGNTNIDKKPKYAAKCRNLNKCYKNDKEDVPVAKAWPKARSQSRERLVSSNRRNKVESSYTYSSKGDAEDFEQVSLLQRILERLDILESKSAGVSNENYKCDLSKYLEGKKSIQEMLRDNSKKELANQIDLCWDAITEEIIQAANKNIPFKKVPNTVANRKKKLMEERSPVLQDTIKLSKILRFLKNKVDLATPKQEE
ncbi:8145_t:CDS:2, partial [Gigaspora rosea]